MTKITAKIVADSCNEFGNRITTFVCTYPRIIHAEVMTHRMFSRNAASSRAVPAEKLIQAVIDEPFIPIAFQKNHKGMQGTEYILNQDEIDFEIKDWLDDRDYAVKKAKARLERGVTKQLVNRPLEPFQYYTSIITATEWENFFALRCPSYRVLDNDVPRYFRSRKDVLSFTGSSYGEGYTETDWLQQNEGQAEIHMMALAEAMWDAMNESTPKELKVGDWHIPFGDNFDLDKLIEINPDIRAVATLEDLQDIDIQNKWLYIDKVRIATARCARVSYTVVGEEGKPDNYENDIKLHNRLATSGHWSPFEHCAKVMDSDEYPKHIRTDNGDNNGSSERDGFMYDSMFINDKDLGWSGNFRGFIQYRKMFNNENITK